MCVWVCLCVCVSGCECVGVHELKVDSAGITVRLLPVGEETIHTMDLFPPYFPVTALNVC